MVNEIPFTLLCAANTKWNCLHNNGLKDLSRPGVKVPTSTAPSGSAGSSAANNFAKPAAGGAAAAGGSGAGNVAGTAGGGYNQQAPPGGSGVPPPGAGQYGNPGGIQQPAAVAQQPLGAKAHIVACFKSAAGQNEEGIHRQQVVQYVQQAHGISPAETNQIILEMLAEGDLHETSSEDVLAYAGAA